jgi:hypothetical protein
MEVSGKPTEGWMTFVPLSVFVFVVVVALGGPTGFVHTVRDWFVDFVTYVAAWVKHL